MDRLLGYFYGRRKEIVEKSYADLDTFAGIARTGEHYYRRK